MQQSIEKEEVESKRTSHRIEPSVKGESQEHNKSSQPSSDNEPKLYGSSKKYRKKASIGSKRSRQPHVLTQGVISKGDKYAVQRATEIASTLTRDEFVKGTASIALNHLYTSHYRRPRSCGKMRTSHKSRHMTCNRIELRRSPRASSQSFEATAHHQPYEDTPF